MSGKALLLMVCALSAAPASQPTGVTVVKAGEAPVHALSGGSAELLLNPDSGSPKAAVTRLTLQPGASVAAHRHPDSDELLVILAGSATMIAGGSTYVVKTGDAVRIAAGVEHSATVSGTDPLVAIQIYVAPGPEARFRQGPRQGR